MSLKAPEFLDASGYNTFQEFLDFLSVSKTDGPHLAAELARLHTFRCSSAIPRADQILPGFYGRVCDGWVVFYAIEQLPIRVTVLLAGDLAMQTYSNLEAEAIRRLGLMP
ncbi:MAG TPA: hypothetical protein VMH86_00245 [Rhizomicrobium sp.]|nr:hypothetical protein [Rhizomicrobium sp.]